MRQLGLFLLLAGCSEATFYNVDVVGAVSDLDGEPIFDQRYSLCATATFDDDEVVDGGCDEGTTNDLGEVEMNFSHTTAAALTRVTSTLTVADTDIVHDGVVFISSPDEQLKSGVNVLVQSEYAMDRSLLPERTTRFDIGGFVSEIENGFDRTGTITVYSSIEPGTPPDFEGSSPVTTGSDAGFRVDVDLTSDWDFPISTDRLRLVMTLDGGEVLEGNFEILDAMSGTPRTVDIIATF